MIDPNMVRQYAEQALSTNKVHLASEVPIGREDCSLSIWTAIGSKPSSYVTLFESAEGVFVTTSDYGSFERFLKMLRPNLHNVDTLQMLFRKAAPIGLCLVESMQSIGWMKKYEAVWHEPRHTDNGTDFFCCDLQRGRFFRAEISGDFDLTIEDIGPGKRIPRR